MIYQRMAPISEAPDTIFLERSDLKGTSAAVIGGTDREAVANLVVFDQPNPESVTNARRGEWANVAFSDIDIVHLTPDWTEEQRVAFLKQHEGVLTKAMYEVGLAVIHALLHARES